MREDPVVPPPAPLCFGRYTLHGEIAHGGMATVHVGRLMGPVGFSRTVAVKRLHSNFAKDPEFVAMFMDEARVASRIQHPHVVSIIDVVAEKGELLLVMDYVQGESVSRLLRASRSLGELVDPRIAVKVLSEVLGGLHAAHEARSERGLPLGIVHRDVSPQNVLIGVDGVAHVIDFGVAKAAGRMQHTRDGQIKGKLAYMAPEQIRGASVDRRTDIYAASAVLWEMLAGRRLFTGDDATLMFAVLTTPISPPSASNPAVPPELDAVVMKGLQRNPDKRYATALEMADALEAALAPASSREVARWLERLAGQALLQRASLVAEIESLSGAEVPPARAELISELSDISGGSPAAAERAAESPAAVPDSPSAVPVVKQEKDSHRTIWLMAGLSLTMIAAAASFLAWRLAVVSARPDAPPGLSAAAPSAPAQSTPALPAASPSDAPPAVSVAASGSPAEPPATAGSSSAKPAPGKTRPGTATGKSKPATPQEGYTRD